MALYLCFELLRSRELAIGATARSYFDVLQGPPKSSGNTHTDNSFICFQLTLQVTNWAEETAQEAKCLPCQCDDLSADPQNPHKAGRSSSNQAPVIVANV